MRDARLRSDWGRHSTLLALLFNCHRDPKRCRKPAQPGDFDPFVLNAPTPKPPKVGVEILKAVYIDRHARKETHA